MAANSKIEVIVNEAALSAASSKWCLEMAFSLATVTMSDFYNLKNFFTYVIVEFKYLRTIRLFR